MFGKIERNQSKQSYPNKKRNLIAQKTLIVSKSSQNDDKFQRKINEQVESLQGSKFRILNELLYTQNSEQAFQHFKENPEDFDEYHKGYQLQVEKWPENPVNTIIQLIESAKYTRQNKLVLCDLGCGDGKIEEYFTQTPGPVRKVFSYDLQQYKPYVRVADSANLPRKTATADASIFSLSLMGTNYLNFIQEAFRITKREGILVIAEVVSRIPSLNNFIDLINMIGYKLIFKDTHNTLFVLLVFRKTKDTPQIDYTKQVKKDHLKQLGLMRNQRNITYMEHSQDLLKPCLYKRR